MWCRSIRKAGEAGGQAGKGEEEVGKGGGAWWCVGGGAGMLA